jgi:hypothetical protein
MPINSRKRVVIQLEHKYNLRGYFVIHRSALEVIYEMKAIEVRNG